MMDQGDILGRGIGFPPRVGPDGRVAWSAGPENVRESIYIILMTDFEERLMRPEFGGGLRAYLFRPNTAATRQLVKERAERALLRWEPRIEVRDVAVEPASDDPRAAVMVIRYALVATGSADQIGLALRFSG